MLGHKQAQRGEERGEMKLIELIIRMILTSYTFNLLDRQLIMRVPRAAAVRACRKEKN